MNKASFDINVVDAAKVDYGEIVKLQRKSFEGVTGSEELNITQVADYYQWKYEQPIGYAKVAQVRDKDRNLVAMNSAFPLTLIQGNKTLRGWQACDSATHPSARGKGLFYKCIQAISASLENNELCFGYPNINAEPAYHKLGWKTITKLRLFAGIIPGFSRRPCAHEINRFGQAQDMLAGKIAKPDQIMILRNAAYMNNRYFSPRRPLYTCFAYEDDHGYQGYIVVRYVSMHGLRFAMIMECFALNENVERKLYLHVGSWCLAHRCLFTLTLTATKKALGLFGRGLCPVPHKLVPRPLILMGEAKGPDAQAFLNQKWGCFVGDWDGF